MNLKFTADVSVWGLLLLLNINYLDAWNERLYMLHICAKILHLQFTFFTLLKNFLRVKKKALQNCSSYESVLSRVKKPSFFPLALHEFNQEKKIIFALRDDERLVGKEGQVASKRSKYSKTQTNTWNELVCFFFKMGCWLKKRWWRGVFWNEQARLWALVCLNVTLEMLLS